MTITAQAIEAILVDAALAESATKRVGRLPRKPRSIRMRVVCLECGKTVSTNSAFPACNRCGSSDMEIA